MLAPPNPAEQSRATDDQAGKTSADRWDGDREAIASDMVRYRPTCIGNEAGLTEDRSIDRTASDFRET